MPAAPAGMKTTSPGLTHFPAAYYKRTGLDRLMKKFVFRSICQDDEIPLREGTTIQWYRVDLPGANTTSSPEGTTQTSLGYATSTLTATVKEYSDYISASTFLIETDISPTAENMVKWLSYRAGLSVDTIVRIELDTLPSANHLSMEGTSFAAVDAATARHLLKGQDIDGTEMDGEEFVGFIHPYVSFDLMSDNSAGGWLDVKKYTKPEDIINGEIGKVGGVRFVETTNGGTSTVGGNTTYNTYVIGDGAIGAVSLAGRGPSNVKNPKRQTFKVKVITGGADKSDPEGKIGTMVSYRFVFVAKLLDTTTYRYYIVDADPTLV